MDAQVKAVLNPRQVLLLNCYKAALKKVDFLLQIPHLTQRLLNGEVTQLESIWGPEILNSLLQLHKRSMVNDVGDAGGSPVNQYHQPIRSEVEGDVSDFKPNAPERQLHQATVQDGITQVDEHFRFEVMKIYGQLFRQVILRSDFVETSIINSTRKRCKRSKSETSLGIPRASEGLLLFQVYAIQFMDLFQSRLYSSIESKEMAQLKRYWKREICHQETLKMLQTKQKTNYRAWDCKIGQLENEIEAITRNIEQIKIKAKEGVKRTIRNEVLLDLEEGRRHQLKIEALTLQQLKLETDLKERLSNYLQHEGDWKFEIKILEESLREILASYDESMKRKQAKFDILENTVRENVLKIARLEKQFADTEEQFEEMRITKRLKELLRNMEMAENFKRNRAARIIQSTWRRYRLRKLRRMRRKAKQKRKPRIPGQSKRKP